MSQERTERWTDREVEKDRRIVATANAKIQPGVFRIDSNWLIQFVNIATHYIDLSEQRREERDSNQRLHIQSLEEIDRLNATIAGLQAAVKEQTAKVQERDTVIAWQKSQKTSLNLRLRDAQKVREENEREIDEAAAWAEYWRREAFRQHPTQDAYDEACAVLEKHRERADAGDKEIERLRGVVMRFGTALGRIAGEDITTEEMTEIAQYAIENDDDALRGAE